MAITARPIMWQDRKLNFQTKNFIFLEQMNVPRQRIGYCFYFTITLDFVNTRLLRVNQMFNTQTRGNEQTMPNKLQNHSDFIGRHIKSIGPPRK